MQHPAAFHVRVSDLPISPQRVQRSAAYRHFYQPYDWGHQLGVLFGNAYGVAHNVGMTLWRRPGRSDFEAHA